MNKKMLFVVTDSLPGGVTTSLKNWCRLLIEKGYNVSLLNMSRIDDGFWDLGPDVKRLHLKGLESLWQLSKSDILKEKNIIKKLLLYVMGLIKKATIRMNLWYPLIFSMMKKIEGYDVAFAFRQCEPCYFLTLKKVNAKKKIGFIHGEKKYMGDISSWDKFFPQFDNIVCVSNYVCSEFAEAYKDISSKFCCVYNTFDIQGIKSKSKENTDIKFESNKINFLTVARVDNNFKRLQFVPEICKILKDDGIIDFCWYVIGDGPDLEFTKQYVKKLDVEQFAVFVGEKKNPFPYVKSADLFILCSVSEAYAMTVKEAHVLGIPVLSSDYATAFEAIENGVDGYIVKGTPKDFAEKIKWLMVNDCYELNKLKNIAKGRNVNNDLAYSQLYEILYDKKK